MLCFIACKSRVADALLLAMHNCLTTSVCKTRIIARYVSLHQSCRFQKRVHRCPDNTWVSSLRVCICDIYFIVAASVQTPFVWHFSLVCRASRCQRLRLRQWSVLARLAIISCMCRVSCWYICLTNECSNVSGLWHLHPRPNGDDGGVYGRTCAKETCTEGWAGSRLTCVWRQKHNHAHDLNWQLQFAPTCTRHSDHWCEAMLDVVNEYFDPVGKEEGNLCYVSFRFVHTFDWIGVAWTRMHHTHMRIYCVAPSHWVLKWRSLPGEQNPGATTSQPGASEENQDDKKSADKEDTL